ncbi:Zinc finger protein [Pseudolycoriella hygida]|uniref:Zinc finger protein n=2 Tax=Pseudolycoriella hygida TaxID=35572 RepID=A0A9Q0RVK4_9DIPT|nr:Zinc finger protein [Pseudolycoriella hygida]
MQSDPNGGQIIVGNADGLRNVEILTSPNDRGIAQLGKYWVLTNLFDSPYVYNLTSKTDKFNVDNLQKQDTPSEQHYILSDTQSIPISSNAISIPSSVINTSFQNSQQLLQNITIHNPMNQSTKSSQQILREVLSSTGQHIVLQVSNDDLIVDQSDLKCQKVVQNALQLNDIGQFSHDHQLQVQQIIDNELNNVEASHHIKEEVHSGKPTESLPQITNDKVQLPQMVDIHSGDGVIQMNIDDISQFLNYHEVFGKISNDNILTIPTINTVGTSATSNLINSIQTNSPQPTTKFVTPKLENFSANTEQGADDKQDEALESSIQPGSHACEVCGKIFSFKYQLIVHRRYHNRRKPFICQVCGQAFVSTVELSAHGKSHDGNGNSMFTCNICYHVFANEASLERHMKRHSTDKPFGCSGCLKRFARKEHLDNHFRSHSGESPFRCQVNNF